MLFASLMIKEISGLRFYMGINLGAFVATIVCAYLELLDGNMDLE